jgi:cytochrome b involved in lipid metabolism
MLVKYAMVMSIASIVIMFFLNEYHPSTFIQLSSIYAQLCSSVIDLQAVVLKWFDMGSNTDVLVKQKELLFTKEELKKYTERSKGLYLAILGKVYDVGKGEKFYGPSGSYNFFVGM